jgi:hypothetical protein
MTRVSVFRAVFAPLICGAVLIASAAVVWAAKPTSCECTRTSQIGTAYTYWCTPYCGDDPAVAGEAFDQPIVALPGEDPDAMAIDACMDDATRCP